MSDPPAWTDPAVASCLSKLAPYGRFVFSGDQDTGLPGPVPGRTGPVTDHHAGEDTDPVLDTIEEFVIGVRPVPNPDRFLGTELFVDVAESTKLAAEIGDSRFRDLLTGCVQLVRRQLDGYWLQRGRLAARCRHFGEVTSRTRHRRPYARKAISFSWPFPAAFISAGPQPPSSALCLTRARTGAHYPAGNDPS